MTTLFRRSCVIIGVFLLVGCGISVCEMFYFAYIRSIDGVLLWMPLAFLSGVAGLLLIYQGSEGG